MSSWNPSSEERPWESWWAASWPSPSSVSLYWRLVAHWGCISMTAASKQREVSLPLCRVLVKSILKSCFPFWTHQWDAQGSGAQGVWEKDERIGLEQTQLLAESSEKKTLRHNSVIAVWSCLVGDCGEDGVRLLWKTHGLEMRDVSW